MANGHNLIISYDLKNPDRNYEAVISEIKTLGGWAKVNFSVWFVDSKFTASQARDIVWKKMDSNDSLIVIDAVDNMGAWQNLSAEVSNYVRNNWNIR